MKSFFINLDRCTTKRELMQIQFPEAERITALDGKTLSPESIAPYAVDRYWRDPSWNRRFTKGEVGCILSHIICWKKCLELNEPILILEDDVEVVDPSYLDKASNYIQNFDFLYLARRPVEGCPAPINNDLVVPEFCYWCCAYVITPKVAKILVEYFETNPLIPTDEIVPAILGIHRWDWINADYSLKVAAFKNNLIRPVQGAYEKSETESIEDIWEDFKFHILTVATDPEKGYKLLKKNNNIINLGEGVEWLGGDMSKGPGGGQKINLVKKFLETSNDNDIVMFVDGYDTFISASPNDILSRYFNFRKEIVFSSEKTCWPDKSISDLFPETGGYKFLNSGTYIGTVKALKELFFLDIQDHEDDQLYAQKIYLKNLDQIALDYESYIFLCLSGLEESTSITKSNWIVNEETNCTTCVVHGNGGLYTKKALDMLYASSCLSDIKHTDYVMRPLSSDMIVIENLFSETWCNKVIEETNKFPFKPLDTDAYPAQEVRLDQIDKLLLDEYIQKYYNVIVPICEKYWPKLTMYNIRDLFTIKYTLNTQKSLRLHNDMSLITGSMKLNNDYEGGVLNFPRQEQTNLGLKVGDMLLWPGQVTHPHESLELTSGTKYSLTMWTERLKSGDSYGDYTL